MEEEKTAAADKLSPAMEIITAALKQATDVLNSNEQSLEMLQRQVQQLVNQKIALTAQVSLLKELSIKISERE